MGLFQKPLSGSTHVGFLSEQKVYKFFVLHDILLQGGNVYSCREDQLFRLTHIEHGSGTAVSQEAGEAEGFLARRERALRDFQLQVDSSKLEISPGDISNKGDHDLLANRFPGETVRASAPG